MIILAGYVFPSFKGSGLTKLWEEFLLPDIAKNGAEVELLPPGADTSYRRFVPAISDALLSLGVLKMHAAGISFFDAGILFTGLSGTGKTTHAVMWRDIWPEDATILSGDVSLVDAAADAITAYGSPWKGKEGLGCNGSAPLSAVVCLRRGSSNRLVRLPEVAAMTELLNHTRMLAGQEAQVVPLLTRLIGAVPVFELEFVPDGTDEPAKVCHDALVEAGVL